MQEAEKKPSIPSYRRHVLLCAGKHCDPEGVRALVHYFRERLRLLGLLDTEVRLNRAGCLGVCREGAIACIYPDGVWYCRIDAAAVDRIIRHHLIGGAVVEELLFHHHRPPA
ncbi:MAG: ferredoxin [Zetaproteobacteria bacterium]|nr:MAG: ferredoxin [Zetaproteobacteria bacterium]